MGNPQVFCPGVYCSVSSDSRSFSNVSSRALFAAYPEGQSDPVPCEAVGSERWWYSWCLSPQGSLKTDHKVFPSISAGPEMERHIDSGLQ